MRTSRSRAERAENGQATARDAAGPRRATPSGGAAAPPPLTADALRAAQDGAGNAAVTAMIARRVRAEPSQEQPDTGVHDVLRSAGKPLAAPVRQDMESRFGADFSDVRLHTGGAAARSAGAIGARAYTSGSHVVIGDGGGDRHTLAHELTHVVQQRQGPVSGTDTGHGFAVSDPSDRFEQAAEANARRILAGPAPVTHGVDDHVAAQHAAGPVQRRPKKTSKKDEQQTSAAASAPQTSELQKIIDHFDIQIPKFREKMHNEKELILENCGIDPDNNGMGLADVEGDEYILGIVRSEVEDAKYAPGFSGLGGGNSDWAASSVTSAHAELRKDFPHWGENTTLHHKISREDLDRLFAAAEGDKANASPLLEFLDEVKQALRSNAGDKKALRNMPANLEMGPSAGERIDDPGSGPDFNKTPSGAMTPRSDELEQALDLTREDTVDWAAVAGKLREAQRLHQEQYGGAILSPPELARWVKAGAKWKKVL